MSFTDDHKELTSYAKHLVSKLKINAAVDDLVNDCFISLHESGKPYSINNARKAIYKAGFKSVEEKNTKNSLYDDSSTKHIKNTSDLFCKDCNEVKPVSCFRVITIGGCSYTRSDCRECEVKKNTARQSKDKKKHAEYVTKKNREKGVMPREDYLNMIRRSPEFKRLQANEHNRRAYAKRKLGPSQ